jgi:(p)ppGpp synthase/HD superfamily hydrolase
VNSAGELADADARAFLEEVYRTRQHSDGASIEHPLAVARLLHEDGQSDTLVRAGLLHDVLEDTEVTTAEVRERFGREVARLVEALTQDPAIADYDRRKAALREQVLAAGRDAATVALADKAAKLAKESARPEQSRLDHYRATLEGIEQRFGTSPLSERLRAELQRFSD